MQHNNGAYVAAVDIPSGISATSGAVMAVPLWQMLQSHLDI